VVVGFLGATFFCLWIFLRFVFGVVFVGCLVVGDGFVSLVCMESMLGFLVVVVVHVGFAVL
jgi:hypothetical protein